jgi:dihydrofolate reductase
MRKLRVFNSISLDGYFTDKKGDMSWAHKGADDEWNAFASGNASSGGVLVFGRVTYDLMASFWPTRQAKEAFPEIAKGMNDLQKIVFSKSLQKASWQPTKVIKGDIAEEMRTLKKESGLDLVIMGSGTIVSQFTEAGLIDEYQMVVIPIVLGGGRTMFEGVKRKVDLKLRKSRAFRNGNVVLWYDAR